LSPNPFDEAINVEFVFHDVKEYATFELLNKLGQVIESQHLANIKDGKIAFDGNPLSSGLYFVRINTGSGVSSVQKIIKY